MIVTENRTCVLLASEDMITQRIDTHLAGAKRATVRVVGKHLGDGRSETPVEKSLPNIRRETSLQLIRGKVRHKIKRAPVEVHLLRLHGYSTFTQRQRITFRCGVDCVLSGVHLRRPAYSL